MNLPLNLLSLLLDQLSFLSLFFLAVFSPSFSPSSHPSITHPLSAHVLSSSSSFDLSFDQTTPFLHPFQHIFSFGLVTPAYFFQSSPQPHLQCLQPVDFILQQRPCLTSIQYNWPHQYFNHSLFYCPTQPSCQQIFPLIECILCHRYPR